MAIKKSIVNQIKAESKTVPAETKQLETKRPPRPQPSILAEKYPRLKEIDDKIKERQRKSILTIRKLVQSGRKSTEKSGSSHEY